MTKRARLRLVPAVMLALGAAYALFVAYVNLVFEEAWSRPSLRHLARHFERVLLTPGRWELVFFGIALLTLIGIAVLFAGRTRTATTLAVLALLLAFIAEATGISRARDLERMQVSVRHLRLIGESLVARQAPLPRSLAGTSYATLSDGWGNAFRYQRVSDEEALIVAANRDHAFAPVPQHQDAFALGDLDHDVVLLVSRRGHSFRAYPGLPAAGDGCNIRSIFGCILY